MRTPGGARAPPLSRWLLEGTSSRTPVALAGRNRVRPEGESDFALLTVLWERNLETA